MTKLSEKIASIHWRVWFGLLLAIIILRFVPEPAYASFAGGGRGVYAHMARYMPEFYGVISSLEFRSFLYTIALPCFVISLQMLASFWFSANGAQFRRWMIWPMAGLGVLVALELVISLLDATMFRPFELRIFLEHLASLIRVAVIVSPTAVKLFSPLRDGRVTTALWWEVTIAGLLVGHWLVAQIPSVAELFRSNSWSGALVIRSGAVWGIDQVFEFSTLAVFYYWLDRMARQPFNRLLAAANYVFFLGAQLIGLFAILIANIQALFPRGGGIGDRLQDEATLLQVSERLALMQVAGSVCLILLFAELAFRRFRNGADVRFDPDEARTARRWAAAIFTGLLLLNLPIFLVVMAL